MTQRERNYDLKSNPLLTMHYILCQCVNEDLYFVYLTINTVCFDLQDKLGERFFDRIKSKNDIKIQQMDFGVFFCFSIRKGGRKKLVSRG